MKREESVWHPDDRERLKHNVRMLLAQNGESSQDAAYRIGVSPGIMSHLNNIQKPVHLDTVEKIAAYFNVATNDLLSKNAKIIFTDGK